jgi:hypothetical protein
MLWRLKWILFETIHEFSRKTALVLRAGLNTKTVSTVPTAAQKINCKISDPLFHDIFLVALIHDFSPARLMFNYVHSNQGIGSHATLAIDHCAISMLIQPLP